MLEVRVLTPVTDPEVDSLRAVTIEVTPPQKGSLQTQYLTELAKVCNLSRWSRVTMYNNHHSSPTWQVIRKKDDSLRGNLWEDGEPSILATVTEIVERPHRTGRITIQALCDSEAVQLLEDAQECLQNETVEDTSHPLAKAVKNSVNAVKSRAFYISAGLASGTSAIVWGISETIKAGAMGIEGGDPNANLVWLGGVLVDLVFCAKIYRAMRPPKPLNLRDLEPIKLHQD